VITFAYCKHSSITIDVSSVGFVFIPISLCFSMSSVTLNKEWLHLLPLCRNPTLAKCGGEAQHLEKVRIWSPLGLPNVQSSTARPKTPRIDVFLVSLERS
jgi:hypothetical protein